MIRITTATPTPIIMMVNGLEPLSSTRVTMLLFTIFPFLVILKTNFAIRFIHPINLYRPALPVTKFTGFHSSDQNLTSDVISSKEDIRSLPEKSIVILDIRVFPK